MYIHFVRRFGIDLIQISTASTRLQGLLMYIKDVTNALNFEWKAMNKLFLSSLESLADLLEENGKL